MKHYYLPQIGMNWATKCVHLSYLFHLYTIKIVKRNCLIGTYLAPQAFDYLQGSFLKIHLSKT